MHTRASLRPDNQPFSPLGGVCGAGEPFFDLENIALNRSSSSWNSCDGFQSSDVLERDMVGRGRADGTGRVVSCRSGTLPIGTNPPGEVVAGCLEENSRGQS